MTPAAYTPTATPHPRLYTLADTMTGRPTRIDQVHGYDPTTGAEITVADALCSYLRDRNFLESACNLVNVDVSTVRQWLRDGARAHERRLAGARQRDLTSYQRKAAAFSLAARHAMADAEISTVATLALLAQGGIPQTTITEETEYHYPDATDTDPNPDPYHRTTKRTVRTTHTLPDATSLRWFLERRFPDHWRNIDRIDIDLHLDDDLDGGKDPLEEFLGDLAAIARRKGEVMAQLEEVGALDVIDVASHEEPDGPINLGDQP